MTSPACYSPRSRVAVRLYNWTPRHRRGAWVALAWACVAGGTVAALAVALR